MSMSKLNHKEHQQFMRLKPSPLQVPSTNLFDLKTYHQKQNKENQIICN